jgi:hypothetical protein
MKLTITINGEEPHIVIDNKNGKMGDLVFLLLVLHNRNMYHQVLTELQQKLEPQVYSELLNNVETILTTTDNMCKNTVLDSFMEPIIPNKPKL